MELGKYKKAMRPKKYLTRDFIVYQDPSYTSVVQGYGSLDTPPEGVEMRIDKQAGGVVQREGFSVGQGARTDLGKKGIKELPSNMRRIFDIVYPEKNWEDLSYTQRGNFISDFPRREKILNSIPKNYITLDELAEKLNIKRTSINEPRTTLGKFINENLQPQTFGNIAGKGGGSTKYYKDPGVRLTKKILRIAGQDVRIDNLRKNTVRNINKLYTTYYDDFYKKGLIPNIEDIKIMSSSEAGNATTRLAQILDGKKFKNKGLEKIRVNKKIANKMFEELSKFQFGNPYQSQLYKISLETIDQKLGNKKGTFNALKNKAKNILKENKIPIYDAKSKNPYGFNINEIAGVAGSAKSKAPEFSQFIDIMEGELNQKDLAAFQSVLSRARGDIELNPNALEKQMKKVNSYASNLEKKFDIKLPRIRSASDITKYYTPKRLEELKKQGLDIAGASKRAGYTIQMPKGAQTIQEFLKNPQLFQVAEASFGDVCRVKKSTGGKISGESYDACIARNLSETIGDAGSADEAKRGKAMGKLMQMTRSAKTVGKGALRGLQSILIGTGPIEIPIALGLEVAAPIYNYFQGEKLETILGSAPLLGYALSKINPEKFSEEAIQKLIYESGLNEEEQKQAANLVAQLKRYTTMKDLFRQKESLPDYYQQLIDEGADPTSTTNMMEAKIAELDKLIKKNADEFGAEENKVTADQIRIIGKGISNAAEEAQFQKEKTFLHKYLYNPAADPMTVRDYIDRKKMSYLDRIFYGDDLGMSAGIRPELRTIPTPEIKDYYGDSMVPTPFAEGGVVERKGFADGPKIGRRGFLGLLAGIVASLKVGSFGGTGKKVTTQVAKKVIKDAPTGTPEWFAPLVDKVFKEGIDASQTMKTTEREIVKKLEVPSPNSDGALTDTYYLYQNTDTGEIRIDIDAPGAGVNGEEFSLYMRPDRVEGVTDDGLPMIDNGEFVVLEQRAMGRMDGPDDYVMELDQAVVGLDDSASNWHAVEEFATGKTNKKAEAEQLKKKDYIERNPADDIENRYGPFDDTPPDDY